MKYTKQITAGASALAMLLLILDTKAALSGASDGIELCIRTVIPSLFPFFIVSILLTGTLMGADLTPLRPIGRYCRISKGAECLLIAGFLGGYPVGAQAISDAQKEGQISAAEAERMMAFCNNAGPAFVFGMASSLFPAHWMAWALWGIHIFSALLVSRYFPSKQTENAVITPKPTPTLPEALVRSIRVMASVCGWIIVFRVVIAFFDRWFSCFLPKNVFIILTGILELSNGCCALAKIESVPLRFVLCSAMLAFGGICVTAQTRSAAKHVRMRCYLQGKLLQSAFSLCLSLLVIRPNPMHGLLAAAVIAPSFKFIGKSSRFPAKLGV